MLYTTGSAEIVTVSDPLTGEPIYQIVQTKTDPTTGETTQVVSPLPKTNTGLGLSTQGTYLNKTFHIIWGFQVFDSCSLLRRVFVDLWAK